MLVEATDLNKVFRRGPPRRQSAFAAVADVCMAVPEGAFATISGKSGSGKTTLLTLLAGLASPTSGAVYFQGRNLHALSDRELSALRNREIGFVPQGMSLLGNLTVYDNVRSPQLFARGGAPASERADFLLEAVGLADLAAEYPRALSGGEMRRASIARALFNEPALLVADEPTSDLDPENAAATMELLQKINKQGVTMIVVTHEKNAAALGSRQFVMSGGRLSSGAF